MYTVIQGAKDKFDKIIASLQRYDSGKNSFGPWPWCT